MMNGMPAKARFRPPGNCSTVKRNVVVLPQHDVVLEEDRVVRAQMDFGHRNDFAFHLAGAGAELKLGHVAEARGFAPAGLADQVANVERSAARAAGERGLLVHALAPLALDAFERLCLELIVRKHLRGLVSLRLSW